MSPDIEAATTDQILPMVKHDLGIGFLPESFVRDALAKKEVFALNVIEQLPARQICLVRDLSRPASIAAQKLEKMCRELDEEKRVKN